MPNYIYPSGLPIAMSLMAYNAFLTGLMVFLKRRDAAGNRYFITNIFIALWGVSLSFTLNNQLPLEIAARWGMAGNFFALFIPVTWLHFVFDYLEIKRRKWILWFFYFLTALLVAVFPTKYFLLGFRSIVGIRWYPIGGPAYYFFAAVFFSAVALFLFLFVREILRLKESERRKDICYIFWASVYGFITGGLSFLPVFGIPLPQYNLLLMPFWQIALTYAMVRHNAFDAETAAQAAHRDKLAALGTIAASMNHEIRSPLYVVQGRIETYLENIQDKKDAPLEEKFEKAEIVLNHVSSQIRRAMETLQRFSDFSKPFNIKTEKETVTLAALFASVRELVSHAFQSQNIALTEKIDPEVQIRCNRRQMEEVLVNLVINACQAIKQGVQSGGGLKSEFGRIEIRAERNKNALHIEIADNGPGMDPSQLKRIFEPFYTTKEKGTGLGLYITKQLVERNGGKISVKSKVGQGTLFKIEFK